MATIQESQAGRWKPAVCQLMAPSCMWSSASSPKLKAEAFTAKTPEPEVEITETLRAVIRSCPHRWQQLPRLRRQAPGSYIYASLELSGTRAHPTDRSISRRAGLQPGRMSNF